MKQERILVWKDAAMYDKVERQYKHIHKQLQQLVDGLVEYGITPTMEHVDALLKGKDVSDEVTDNTEQTLSETFKLFPKGMKRIIAEMFQKGKKEEYAELVGNKIASLKHSISIADFLVDFQYFSIENGNVILSDEYVSSIEKMFCVFIDSPSKHAVYEKWLKLKEAALQFDEAVKKAPKREATKLEKHAGVSGDDLTSLEVPERFSLAKLTYEGELVLNGEYFELIK